MSKAQTVKTVVVTGGGSGGHITPILAVARALKQTHPGTKVVYISQTGDSLDDVVAQSPYIDEMHAVRSGKFRRYHGEGIERFFDFKTIGLNIRDAFRVLIGLWQAFWLLGRIQPNIIFTRGSYVSVPVCLSAAVRRIPYITHDSDAIPSLTNRLIARWAAVHAVAMPEELYPYPIDKTINVGVPSSEDYRLVTDEIRQRYKRELKLDGYDQVLLVTGGGHGADRLNTAVVANAPELLKRYPGLAIVHLTGRLHEAKVIEAYKNLLPPEGVARVAVKGFVTDMYRYTGAASLVIARAGATTLAELALQGKTCIIVPNPQLTGGHQLKNTAALRDKGAIIEMTEDQLEQELRLASVVAELFDNPKRAAAIGKAFADFAKPDAAEHIVEIMMEKAR